MYNNQLRETIEANEIAIIALKAQQPTVWEDNKKELEAIANEFRVILMNCNSYKQFIAERMMPTFECYISERNIRLGWKRYSDEKYTNTIDISYRSPDDYENTNQKLENNHKWEISLSSSRFYANSSEAGKNLENPEPFDQMKLAIGIYDLLSEHPEHFYVLHERVSACNTKAYRLSNTIEKLERQIRDAQEQMEKNRIIRLFKPGGQTAVCRFGNDIFPVTPYWYDSSRRTRIHFDAVNLVKETKKGIRVEFIRISKNSDSTDNRWINDTKWLTLGQLVTLFTECENAQKRKLEREAEREARRKEQEAKELENHLDKASEQKTV